MSLSDDEVELLLTLETRMIPMPNGREAPHTNTMLFWEALDYIGEWGYTPEKVSELAMRDMKEMGRPFELSFASTVCFIQLEYRRAFGDRRPVAFQRS